MDMLYHLPFRDWMKLGTEVAEAEPAAETEESGT